MRNNEPNTTGSCPAPFGVRLDAATLARLDAYAERIDKKRGGAAARVIAAGLDVLEGLPVNVPVCHDDDRRADAEHIARCVVEEILATMEAAAWARLAVSGAAEWAKSVRPSGDDAARREVDDAR